MYVAGPYLYLLLKNWNTTLIEEYLRTDKNSRENVLPKFCPEHHRMPPPCPHEANPQNPWLVHHTSMRRFCGHDRFSLLCHFDSLPCNTPTNVRPLSLVFICTEISVAQQNHRYKPVYLNRWELIFSLLPELCELKWSVVSFTIVTFWQPLWQWSWSFCGLDGDWHDYCVETLWLMLYSIQAILIRNSSHFSCWNRCWRYIDACNDGVLMLQLYSDITTFLPYNAPCSDQLLWLRYKWLWLWRTHQRMSLMDHQRHQLAAASSDYRIDMVIWNSEICQSKTVVLNWATNVCGRGWCGCKLGVMRSACMIQCNFTLVVLVTLRSEIDSWL